MKTWPGAALPATRNGPDHTGMYSDGCPRTGRVRAAPANDGAHADAIDANGRARNRMHSRTGPATPAGRMRNVGGGAPPPFEWLSYNPPILDPPR